MTETDVAQTNTKWARALVDELSACGLQDVCIAPGARSTPLVAAFTDHPQIRDHTIIDERSLAFFALGIARSTRRPVALLCTSGTAGAHFLAALSEADRSGVPMIVMTADRPAKLRDSGAPQTMDQRALYGARLRWFHELAPAKDSAEERAYLRSMICRGWAIATSAAGPVHFNVPFERPLCPPTETQWRPTDRSAHRQVLQGTKRLGEGELDQLADLFEKAQRPIVIAGVQPFGAAYDNALIRWAEENAVPVLAEAQSGLRFKPKSNAIIAGDLLLSCELYLARSKPDLIVQLGPFPTHWPVQRWLESHRSVPHITFDRHLPNHPHFPPTWVIDADEDDTFSRLAATEGKARDREWLDWHVELARRVNIQMRTSLQSGSDFSDGRVFSELAELVEEPMPLVVSSSMVVRNFELYMTACDQRLAIHINRGLNGIDGLIAMGLGVAKASRLKTLIVVGDVAFVHDVGSLASVSSAGINALIIVINNGGGSIFDSIPKNGLSRCFKKHFSTKPNEEIFASEFIFGVKLTRVDTLESFRKACLESMKTPGIQILDCHTAPSHDDRARLAADAEATLATAPEIVTRGSW
jgi:2-succinyl-5-enolpyruvyl-6-hydroxy-3-cyclohexene-1-carboxylate synthase